MPSSIVTMMPPGSFPGIKSLAITPTISPKTIHPRMPNMRTPPPRPMHKRVPSGCGRWSVVLGRWRTVGRGRGRWIWTHGRCYRRSTIGRALLSEPRIHDRVEDRPERIGEADLQVVLVAAAQAGAGAAALPPASRRGGESKADRGCGSSCLRSTAKDRAPAAR